MTLLLVLSMPMARVGPEPPEIKLIVIRGGLSYQAPELEPSRQ